MLSKFLNIVKCPKTIATLQVALASLALIQAIDNLRKMNKIT